MFRRYRALVALIAALCLAIFLVPVVGSAHAAGYTVSAAHRAATTSNVSPNACFIELRPLGVGACSAGPLSVALN